MKQLLIILVFTLVSFAAFAQQEEYQKKTYVSSENDTLLYRELVPEKLILNQSYPLVIFLHGAGERGNDNEAQLRHGGNMFEATHQQSPAHLPFSSTCQASHP